MMKFEDVLQAIMLGAGLAMDAASVSMTNGMVEKKMKIGKMLFIALMFGIFQGMMPLIGYFLGSLFTDAIANYVSYIGFALLAFLGIKMIIDGIKNEEEESGSKLTFFAIFLQAIATSIDALATGIIYIEKEPNFVIIVFSIVAIVTFILSFVAIIIGKKFGELLNRYAIIIGGLILLSIGFKLLLNDYFFIYLIVLAVDLFVLFLILFKKYKKKFAKLNKLVEEIKVYQPVNKIEEDDKEEILKLVKEKKLKSFSRDNDDIHFTSSAIVLNKDKTKVLFCYHNIYNSWSWLGGHADSEVDLLSVAEKEIKEETGLERFSLINNGIISIEILNVKGHIKNDKYVKQHRHANVTYAFVADEDNILKINENENSDVKFLEIDKLDQYVSEEHMLPIYHKILDKLTKSKIVL